jgi:DNA-binding LacI/PurR family transcriptional regulator
MKTAVAPTLASVGRLARVSVSTVSRALRDDLRISEQTRLAVQRAAAETGYAPNALARSLALRNNGIIGLVIPERPSYLYQENLAELVRIAADRGHQLLIFQVPATKKLLDIIPAIVAFRPMGCLVLGSVNVSPACLHGLQRYAVSAVMLDRAWRKGAVGSVVFDHASGARRLAEFLVTRGYRSIGIVAGLESTLSGRQRITGFVKALDEHGLKPRHIVPGHFTFEGGYAAGTNLLKLRPDLDAIFASNDLMAFGVMDAVRKAGLSIPEDVGVVGFDNSTSAAWPAYNLTTVTISVVDMFKAALDLLRSYKVRSKNVRIVSVSGELVVRQSTKM